MNIATAIEKLSKLPPNAELMVPSLGHGGSVPLQGFEDLGPMSDGDKHWISVHFCEDHEFQSQTEGANLV